VALLKLAHVYAHHGGLVAEQSLGQRTRELRLTDARGPEEQEALPMGRLGSPSPALARLMASAMAPTASSCPITRSCNCSSRHMSLSRSSWVSWLIGMPVALLTTSAMSSAVTSAVGSALAGLLQLALYLILPGPELVCLLEVLGGHRLILLPLQVPGLLLERPGVPGLGLGA
jgi:hypothetical protein